MPIENNYTLENIARRSQRSEMVQEIISSKSSFLVKYGLLFFACILILLLASCWFIQYPDIVSTKAKLTSINAPKVVITKASGKLIKLFANEGEQVKQCSILGFLESTASHEDVIALSKKIDQINSSSQFHTPFIEGLEVGLSLGELQPNYQTYKAAEANFKNYLSNGFYFQKVNMLNRDLSFLQKMHSNLLQQKGLSTEDLKLTQKTYEANKSLNTDKVISDFDYRLEASKLINKKLTLPQISSSIISNEAQQNEKLKEIAELQNTISQQKSIFEQALNTFKSHIDEWKQKYLLIASIDGKIAFATFLQENQQLQANQTICFVNPENTEYYAEVYIPQTNFGKVKLGQQVLLKFPSYPFQEYGSVKGNIAFISNINTDSGYVAKVILPVGLSTSYKKQIQFRDGLQAQGEIITQNMRLLQRFYYNIVKQVKN